MRYNLISVTSDQFPVCYHVEKPDGDYYVVQGTHAELICDCPQARYRDPRCKHVIMIENAIEMKTFCGDHDYAYDTETERLVRDGK